MAKFLREVFSENGRGSFSRVCSTIMVLAYVYLMIATRGIPERTEELAWILAALYGANQLKSLGRAIAFVKQNGKEPNGAAEVGKL